MAKLTQLHSWWLSLSLPWRKWRIVAYVSAADEIPDELPDRGVVVVGTEQCPTWIALDCPCSAGHRLLVNLDNRRNPHWKISSSYRLSLRPSIDSTVHGRRCHFVLDKGKIRWAHNSQETST